MPPDVETAAALFVKLEKFHHLESAAMYRGVEHVNFHINKAIIARNALKLIAKLTSELL